MNMLQYVYAAADADILSMATSTVSTLKDNIIGVLTEVAPVVALIFASVLILFFAFKLVRRAIGR